MPCRSGIVCPLCRQDWDDGEHYSLGDAVNALQKAHRKLMVHHTQMETDYEGVTKRLIQIEEGERSLRLRSQKLKAEQTEVSERIFELNQLQNQERSERLAGFSKQELINEILRR